MRSENLWALYTAYSPSYLNLDLSLSFLTPNSLHKTHKHFSLLLKGDNCILWSEKYDGLAFLKAH